MRFISFFLFLLFSLNCLPPFISSAFADSQTNPNSQRKVSQVYKKISQALKEFSTDTANTAVDIDSGSQMTSLELNAAQSEIVKTLIEKEFKRIDEEIDAKKLSHTNSKVLKIFHQFKPKNTYEKNRNYLTVIRFSIAGTITGFAIFFGSPESPYLLTGLVAGSVSSLMQYGNSSILDFLEYPLRIKKGRPFFDKSWASSQQAHYIKTFIIGTVYLAVVQATVNLIDQKTFLSPTDFLEILKLSAISAIFIGALEKTNIQMRIKKRKQLVSQWIKDIKKKEDSLRDFIFNELKHLESFELFKTEYMQENSYSVIEKIIHNQHLPLNVKETLIQKIIKKTMESSYSKSYHSLKKFADLRTIINTSMVSGLSLTALIQESSSTFLGFNPIELFMLTSGPLIALIYNSYAKTTNSIETKTTPPIKEKLLSLKRTCSSLFQMSK